MESKRSSRGHIYNTAAIQQNRIGKNRYKRFHAETTGEPLQCVNRLHSRADRQSKAVWCITPCPTCRLSFSQIPPLFWCASADSFHPARGRAPGGAPRAGMRELPFRHSVQSEPSCVPNKNAQFDFRLTRITQPHNEFFRPKTYLQCHWLTIANMI